METRPLGRQRTLQDDKIIRVCKLVLIRERAKLSSPAAEFPASTLSRFAPRGIGDRG